MVIVLKDFQKEAINKLLQYMDEPTVNNIILKSPTGSGKTIILINFMNEYLKSHPKTVFIWLTPGKGGLAEQSKEKMDRYIHNSQTKLLSDIMTSGFEDGDSCFINWEKLTKKGNNALKDSERTNFMEWIEKAKNSELNFKIIIDESHSNFTEKSEVVINLFHTAMIIRCSATPIIDRMSEKIEIKEHEVVSEGLIKKMIMLNENFPQKIEFKEGGKGEIEYLLEKAIEKQTILYNTFKKKSVDIMPLIIVQIRNNSKELLEKIENVLNEHGINYENRELALWISDSHRNIENISNNNSKQKVVIIRQAVATGWDCPRAHILVKIRDNMDDVFQVQTIGRIRRMPEAKHYNDSELDNCYIYTFDKKFIKDAEKEFFLTSAKKLFLKEEFKEIELKKEQRPEIETSRDPRKSLNCIAKYMKDKYDLTTNKNTNKQKLERDLIFTDKIIDNIYSGGVRKINDLDIKNLNKIRTETTLNTHVQGYMFHGCVSSIGREIELEYRYIITIIKQLFCESPICNDKILSLSVKELYAFIINNENLIRHLFREAMSADLVQKQLKFGKVVEKKFTIPKELIFTYDRDNKIQTESKKNVYDGYLMSAIPRSNPERKFEKFCEENDQINWFYKNGDHGNDFFSIVYEDNSNKQQLFYPDYILSINKKYWIIEIKGGFTSSGESKDIDVFSKMKFDALYKYSQKNKINMGFVRHDEKSEELFICVKDYTDDIISENWISIKDFIKSN